MHLPDWHSAPSWLVPSVIATAALLLGVRNALRDRTNTQRAQIDHVSVWCLPKYEWPGLPGNGRTESGHLEWHARNGSSLPVTIARVKYEARTKWCVPDPAYTTNVVVSGVWSEEAGTCTTRGYVDGILLPPGEPGWSYDVGINFAHQAPAGAEQIAVIAGLTCNISWFIVRDDTNRRWEVNPRRGRRARRIHWYSWRRRDYPLEWRRPSTMWLNRQRYRTLDLARMVGQFAVRQKRRLDASLERREAVRKVARHPRVLPQPEPQPRDEQQEHRQSGGS